MIKKDDIEAIATDIAGEANKAVKREGLRNREKRGEGKMAWKRVSRLISEGKILEEAWISLSLARFGYKSRIVSSLQRGKISKRCMVSPNSHPTRR
jgi:hypothetical protein